MALREQRGREASPTAAIIDSQSLKAAERGRKSRVEDDAVGYDAGKQVKGRKLHALVDVEGLPLRVVVHSAGMQDRDGASVVFDKIRQRFPWLELVWADSRLQRSPGQRRGRQGSAVAHRSSWPMP